MEITIKLTDTQVDALERHRVFLNSTRGTSYKDVTELCNHLFSHFARRIVDEVVQRRANKIHAAFKRLPLARQQAMMNQLSVKDDDA